MIYPSRVLLKVKTSTRTGASWPRRSRRSKRTRICSLSLKRAVVVLPLPAAPRIIRNPGLTSASTFNCSGVGVTDCKTRISGTLCCRPHCLGPRERDPSEPVSAERGGVAAAADGGGVHQLLRGEMGADTVAVREHLATSPRLTQSTRRVCPLSQRARARAVPCLRARFGGGALPCGLSVPVPAAS